MIRDGTPADLAAIRDLLGRANDVPYDIRIVAEEKVFGDGVSGPPRVRILEQEGAMRGVAVTCGKYLRILAVDRAHRRRGIGSELLLDSAGSVIAAEAGNYLTPGVVESDLGTIAFLRVHGFQETASTWNLHVEATQHGDRARPFGSAQGRRALAAGERPALLEFIKRHFGGIWAFEAARAVSAFYVPDAGFAVVEANNRGLGTFGPTGVVESERGKGHGRQLLLDALADLRSRGYERVIIPWTDALEFYRRTCNVIATVRFLTFTR